jgi:hypothetical protein
MNNMKISLMFFLSYYQYSYVMKLELSSYVIHLAYRTLCLILHTYIHVLTMTQIEVVGSTLRLALVIIFLWVHRSSPWRML